MISNPGLPVASAAIQRGPRLFSHWQLLSLVPGVIPRLEQEGRVLELEVAGQALLAGLARAYPTSQFIGLTSRAQAQGGQGVAESCTRNLHFRTMELIELSRFRKVDLALDLGGVSDQVLIRDLGRCMAPGGFMVLREEERQKVAILETPTGTRFARRMTGSLPASMSLRHSLITRAFIDAFAGVHVVRLPEDPGFLYYVATAA